MKLIKIPKSWLFWRNLKKACIHLGRWLGNNLEGWYWEVNIQCCGRQDGDPKDAPLLTPRPSECYLTWQKEPACVLSHVWLFMTPWAVAPQTTLSMGFSRQLYWTGLLFPPPGDLPDPGMDSVSLMFPVLAAGVFTTSTTWEIYNEILYIFGCCCCCC